MRMVNIIRLSVELVQPTVDPNIEYNIIQIKSKYSAIVFSKLPLELGQISSPIMAFSLFAVSPELRGEPQAVEMNQKDVETKR